jgi:hypothetical protein
MSPSSAVPVLECYPDPESLRALLEAVANGTPSKGINVGFSKRLGQIKDAW